MGKIDDIISEISLFISGDDWSETPQIRQAVAFYTKACKEVSSKLTECRKLLDKDLVLDAKRINSEMTPSLTERAAKLYLRGYKYERLTQLCGMHNYEVPPLIDMETVKKLRASSTDTAMNDLILRWRKIARTHDTQAKVMLLREIIDSEPSDIKMWESNLITIEQKYIQEIQIAANQAVAEKDGKKVIEYYNLLTSDEWFIKPDENIIEYYRPIVQSIRQAMFNDALEHKRNDLFTAYSIMDPTLIRTLLKEYDAMTRNKLYPKDVQAERAVDDVRKFLQESDEAQAKQKEFEQKESALIALLDKHGSFENIENLYEALRRLDLPMDDTLSLRVAVRREEHISEINRRHVRKCIYCVAAVLLLIGLVAVTFTVIQSYRTYKTYLSQMTELQKNANYEGVMKLYAEVQQKSPLALRFGNLGSINMEAERLNNARIERHKSLGMLLDQGEKELEKANPAQDVLKNILAEAAKLKDDKMSAELSQKFRNFENKFKLHEERIRTAIIDEFEAKISVQLEAMKKCSDDIRNQLPDIDRIALDIENAMSNAKIILNEYASRIPQHVNDTRELVESRHEEVSRAFQDYRQMSDILRNLASPDDAESYLNALKSLPEKAPKLANGIWKDAIYYHDQWNMLVTGAKLSSQFSSFPEDLQKAFQQHNLTTDNSPFAADFNKMNNADIDVKIFNEKIDLMNRTLSERFNRYELAFTDEASNIWRFYSTDEPEFVTGSGSRKPHEIRVEYESDNGEFSFLRIKIEPDNSFTVEDDDLVLPQKFVQLNNRSIYEKSTHKALHYKYLQEIIKDLHASESALHAEKIILRHIDRLAQADINPFARAEITYHLLDLLACCSPALENDFKSLRHTLQSEIKLIANKWQNPASTKRFSREAAKLNEFFAALNIDVFEKKLKAIREIYRKSYSRSLQPAGIIIKTGQQCKVIYFTNIGNISELWIYSMNKNKGWIMLPGSAVTANGMLKHNIHDLVNGTIFFAPVDGLNTRTLTDEVKKLMDQEGIKLQKWPENWPLNVR